MINTTDALDLSADILDVRDIISRFEELEAQDEKEVSVDDLAEFLTLAKLLEELEGNGGDEQWRGNWYPVTLIRDSRFTKYARESLENCGGIPRDLPDYIEIDWEATAKNIRVDYSPCEINGITYWYR